jgi:hypothetical protein
MENNELKMAIFFFHLILFFPETLWIRVYGTHTLMTFITDNGDWTTYKQKNPLSVKQKKVFQTKMRNLETIVDVPCITFKSSLISLA